MSVLVEPRRAYTAEDLERLSAQGHRYELIDGDLREMSPAGGEHGLVSGGVAADVGSHVRRHRLGAVYAAETGFKVRRDPDTVIAPDWAFVRQERRPSRRSRGFVEVVPDIVLETRSPSASAAEIDDKIRLWLEVGVQRVWDLDPERRVLCVHRPGEAPRVLTEADTLEDQELLPGLVLSVRELFEDW